MLLLLMLFIPLLHHKWTSIPAYYGTAAATNTATTTGISTTTFNTLVTELLLI